MESVLILSNSGPFGSNSAYEAIRLGSGYLGLGEDITCKIILYEDAVLLLKNNLDATQIGVDPLEEGIEMADLTEMPICVVKEDLFARGITMDDLIEYEALEVIDRSMIPTIMQEFDAVFHM